MKAYFPLCSNTVASIAILSYNIAIYDTNTRIVTLSYQYYIAILSKPRMEPMTLGIAYNKYSITEWVYSLLKINWKMNSK